MNGFAEEFNKLKQEYPDVIVPDLFMDGRHRYVGLQDQTTGAPITIGDKVYVVDYNFSVYDYAVINLSELRIFEGKILLASFDLDFKDFGIWKGKANIQNEKGYCTTVGVSPYNVFLNMEDAQRGLAQFQKYGYINKRYPTLKNQWIFNCKLQKLLHEGVDK